MNAIMFMLGALAMLILWKISKIADERCFVEKSDPRYRTPVRIKNGFYYVIPEKEYIEIDIMRNCKSGEARDAKMS